MPRKTIITYLQLHLFELKYNLFIFLITFIYIFFISYHFSDQLIYLLVTNLINQNMLKYFIFTNITEIFMTNFSISISISIFISIHVLMLLGWFFILKGLYKFENFMFIKFYLIFIFFNFLIINLIFANLIPNIWNFLLNLNPSNPHLLTIYFEPKIKNYFTFIFSVFIYTYLISIYFFLLFCSVLNGIFKLKTFLTLRKFFYLQIIILSSFITPPDVTNLLSIFILFIIVFEIFLYLLIYMNKYLRPY